MTQVQFHKTDPHQMIAECNMPEVPDHGDTVTLDGAIYVVANSRRHWKIVSDLMWVVEVHVYLRDP